MVRKNGAEVRRQRIQEIGKYILAKLHDHHEISLSKTLAALQYEFGLTKEKLIEYLSILQNVDRFIIYAEDDKIKRVDET